MKVKLGELLVSENMITVTQLQQGLKAQRVYGGRLGTNLVELGYITGQQLTAFLAKQLCMAAAKPSDFEDIRADIIELVPKDFAIDHQTIPLGFMDKKLRVAFADPLDLKSREEVAFQVGVPVLPVVAPEVLINYALEKYYQHVPNKNFIRLDSEESVAGENSIEDVLIRSPLDELEPEFDEISKVELLKNVGDYSLNDLTTDLFNAVSREDIFRALFRFLEPSFEHLAVFIARRQEIWGWMQQGFNIEQSAFRSKMIDTSAPAKIAQTFAHPDIKLNFELTPDDARVIKTMQGDPQGQFHLFPVVVGGRTVSVIFAAGRAVDVEKILDPIQEALTKVTIALQMVRLRRKLIPTG